jgi:putative addiction module component (TIGR02574 family)
MHAVSELLDLVMQLSPDERASLARELLLSLEPTPLEDVEVEAAWAAEIERRLARVDQGNYSACDWHEAVARIRQSLTPTQGPAS